DEIRCILDEIAVFLDSSSAAEVKIDTAVDAALTEVAIDGTIEAVCVEHFAVVAQIVAEFIRWNSRVFQSRPCVGLSGHESCCAQAALADVPELIFLFFLVEVENPVFGKSV